MLDWGSETACFVGCNDTTFFEGADLFYLKSVTGEVKERGL